jgi:predicted transcriptional regulator
MRQWSKAAAQMVPALLLLGLLLVSLPADARAPTVAVMIKETVVVADASIHGQAVASFTGTVYISDNELQSATVDLSVDPDGWSAEITPGQKMVTGNESFTFSAAVTPPSDAPEGGHLVRIIARAEVAGGPAATAQASISVLLVRNRVQAACLQPVKEARPGDAVYFAVKVTNVGTTMDTFSSLVEGRSGRLERIRYLLDQDSLDVEAGASVYFNVEVDLSKNATPGDYIIVFRAASADSDSSHAELPLTVTIPGPPAVRAGPPGPNYLLWSGISIIVVGVCLVVFIGGTEIGLLAFLQFVLVPLFVRIKKDRVLDHFTRGQIFGFIKANPGTHYIAIQEHLELQNGVLAYHLKVLEREEYITSERDSIYKRFYPRHMKIPRKERQLSRVQRDIVSALRTHPGASQNGLARMLGESKQVIGYHIRVLGKAGLVRVERDAQQTRCYLEGEAQAEPSPPERAPVEPEQLPELVRDIHA